MNCQRLLILLISFSPLVLSQIRNTKVFRTINLETQLVRVRNEITLSRNGDSEYVFTVEEEPAKNLAFISAYIDGKPGVIRKESSEKHDRFIITLTGSSGSIKLTINTVFAGILTPKPPFIAQAEKQFVKYIGNVFLYSPYDTETQQTLVILPKGEVLSYNENEVPVSKTSERLTYGPYSSRPPHSHIPLIIHYESRAPFLTVTSLLRHIEVSHWGNIAVEETIEIIHHGAKLRGPFSRYEYQRGIGKHASVESLKTLLPSSAKDVYYRDEIGNISTSDIRDAFDAIELELRPRFPLFGGWKTKYTIGYNVPAHEYLYRKDDQFGLRMRLVDHIYDSQYVKEIIVKVVLPESAYDLSLRKPYPVDESHEVLKTYLDTFGRPVIVLKSNDLVEEHIQDFSDETGEVRLKTQTIVDEVQSIQEKRTALYQVYVDAISRYKFSKDISRFNTDRRKIETDQKALSHKLSALQTQMSECWSEGAEKLNDLQSLDQRYRELMNESVQLAERLLASKITKPQYQTLEGDLTAKKLDLIEKISHIMDNL